MQRGATSMLPYLAIALVACTLDGALAVCSITSNVKSDASLLTSRTATTMYSQAFDVVGPVPSGWTITDYPGSSDGPSNWRVESGAGHIALADTSNIKYICVSSSA